MSGLSKISILLDAIYFGKHFVKLGPRAQTADRSSAADSYLISKSFPWITTGALFCTSGAGAPRAPDAKTIKLDSFISRLVF